MQVGPSEHVRVVGAPKQLGNWDAGRAPALEPPAKKGGSLWSGTVEGFSVGTAFEFKFAVVPDSDKSPADSRCVSHGVGERGGEGGGRGVGWHFHGKEQDSRCVQPAGREHRVSRRQPPQPAAGLVLLGAAEPARRNEVMMKQGCSRALQYCCARQDACLARLGVTASFIPASPPPVRVCRAALWESIPNRSFQPGGAQTITAVFDKPGFKAGPATAVLGAQQPPGSSREVRPQGQTGLLLVELHCTSGKTALSVMMEETMLSLPGCISDGDARGHRPCPCADLK